MKHTASRLRTLVASSLVALLAGCDLTGVVGIDDPALGSDQCEGTCPSPVFADAVNADGSEVLDMAATPDGGVMILTHFSGKLVLPDRIIKESDQTDDNAVLMKRSADGSISWALHLGANVSGGQIAVQPNGDIVFAGTIREPADFGTGPLYADGVLHLIIHRPRGRHDDAAQGLRRGSVGERPRTDPGGRRAY